MPDRVLSPFPWLAKELIDAVGGTSAGVEQFLPRQAQQARDVRGLEGQERPVLPSVARQVPAGATSPPGLGDAGGPEAPGYPFGGVMTESLPPFFDSSPELATTPLHVQPIPESEVPTSEHRLKRAYPAAPHRNGTSPEAPVPSALEAGPVLAVPASGSTPPSPNGADGAVAGPSPRPEQAQPATGQGTGRDRNGRFTKGWRGGPGNPFARRMARLRSVLLDAVSDEDLAAVVRSMITQAKAGDVAAAKLVLSYTVGKPTPAVDPDRLDLDEFSILDASPSRAEAMRAVADSLPPDLVAELLRQLQPADLAALARKLLGPDPDDEDDEDEDDGLDDLLPVSRSQQQLFEQVTAERKRRQKR